MTLKKILFLIIINTTFIYSQKDKSSVSLATFFENIHIFNFSKALNEINFLKDQNVKRKLIIYLDLKKNNGFENHNYQLYFDNINNKLSLGKKLDLIDLLLATENELFFNNNRITAYDRAHEGLILSKKESNSILQREFLLQIISIYRQGIINKDDNIINYLDELYDLIKTNKTYLFKYYLNKIYLNEMGILKGKENIEDKKLITEKLIKKIDSLTFLLKKDNKLFIEYFHVKALSFIYYKKYDKSYDFFLKELELLNKENSIYFNKYKYENIKEISRNLSLQGYHKKAFNELKKVKKYQSKLNPTKNDFVYNLYVSDIYNGLNKQDSAFLSMKNAFHSSLKLNFKNQNNLISALEVKNKTKEKEIENLQLKQENLTSEAKRKQNQNLFYGALAILFFGGIIYYQNIKNSKRKRLFAEQQKELEKQKNITLLKEQEITTINAMVNGQEKERIRIAEDLHDNIGSVLATLKLHFENLKLNREKKHFNQEALYLKTEKLIDETYFKVRNLAHAKNAGVIANKGLLTAVKIMAEKISDANKISIEVLDFGLEKRLENSLELTVFRIIQELTTNIIKHAEATNATINLSLYDNNLNIIIEDNGKGFTFNTSKLKNDGMGLGSIKTRVKHLKGTFEVDSTLGKGASILINVPV